MHSRASVLFSTGYLKNASTSYCIFLQRKLHILTRQTFLLRIFLNKHNSFKNCVFYMGVCNLRCRTIRPSIVKLFTTNPFSLRLSQGSGFNVPVQSMVQSQQTFVPLSPAYFVTCFAVEFLFYPLISVAQTFAHAPEDAYDAL